jgi:hypothetical protein
MLYLKHTSIGKAKSTKIEIQTSAFKDLGYEVGD